MVTTLQTLIGNACTIQAVTILLLGRISIQCSNKHQIRVLLSCLTLLLLKLLTKELSRVQISGGRTHSSQRYLSPSCHISMSLPCHRKYKLGFGYLENIFLGMAAVSVATKWVTSPFSVQMPSLQDVVNAKGVTRLETASATDLTSSPAFVLDHCPDFRRDVVRNTRTEAQTES